MATITITHIISQKGGSMIFAGIVSDGQILDKGWSKFDSGQIDEIRSLTNMKQRESIANPDNEYVFMCSKVYTRLSEGDDITVQ